MKNFTEWLNNRDPEMLNEIKKPFKNFNKEKIAPILMVSPNPQVAHSVWHSIMYGYLRYFNGRFGVVVVPRREEEKSVRNNPNELRLDE